jgi:hypothetical protein
MMTFTIKLPLGISYVENNIWNLMLPEKVSLEVGASRLLFE